MEYPDFKALPKILLEEHFKPALKRVPDITFDDLV